VNTNELPRLLQKPSGSQTLGDARVGIAGLQPM